MKRGNCVESEKGRSMNPLLTQKIEWGVRVKMGEIVGERKTASTRERRSMVVVRRKEKTRLLILDCPAAGTSRVSPTYFNDTDTRRVRSQPQHSRYFLSTYTSFSSRHPPAIGKCYQYTHLRSKTVAAAPQAKNIANGGDAKFPLPRHLRGLERAKTCRTSR